MQGADLFQTYLADQNLQRIRIRLLQTLLGFIFIASLLTSIALLLNRSDLLSPINGIAPIAALISIVMIYAVSRGHFINIIGSVLLVYLLAMSIFVYGVNGNASTLFVLLSLTLLTSALISSSLIFWSIEAFIVGLAIWVAISSASSDSIIASNQLVNFVFTMVFGLVPFIIGLITRYFVSHLEEIAINSQRTANLLAASTTIGQKVSQMLELNELLNAAVEIIRDRFAFYHVSIFLIDEEGIYAHLTASTGEVGERMLARKHRLPPGGRGDVSALFVRAPGPGHG